MNQIISALDYIHQKGVLHRDLKMENIVLQDKQDPASLKIIDFGISAFVSNDKTGHTGTVLYSPPEAFSNGEYKATFKVDVWALGVILYQLVTKSFPFLGKTEHETIEKICGDKLSFPKSVRLSKN